LVSDSRTFFGITASVLSRIKEVGRTEYGIVFDPPDAPIGTASARTPLGECLLVFVHNDTHSFIVLTIVKKPALLPTEALWRGLAETIERCGPDQPRPTPKVAKGGH
jgi:hypothetical protein